MVESSFDFFVTHRPPRPTAPAPARRFASYQASAGYALHTLTITMRHHDTQTALRGARASQGYAFFIRSLDKATKTFFLGAPRESGPRTGL